MPSPISLSGHVIGLLKEYMHDLVDQASQEMLADERFGFSSATYRPDQALSDLLALLDDRIESEGFQVGLPDNFLHSMWTFCNDAASEVTKRVWLEENMAQGAPGKARIRELTYRALIDYIESPPESSP